MNSFEEKMGLIENKVDNQDRKIRDLEFRSMWRLGDTCRVLYVLFTSFAPTG